MNKVFITSSLVLSLVLFFSCYQEKIAEYENTIENLNSQIALLQEEIDNYKMTDQYYYQSGADEFLNENYWEALVWMGKLKVKFPTSPLLVYANKIIEDAKPQIDKRTSKGAIINGIYYLPGVGDIPRTRNYGSHNLSIINPANTKDSIWRSDNEN